MTGATLEDLVAARGWDAREALQVVAILEDVVAAIWKVHGQAMADRLEVQMNAEREPVP